ncbi:MAG: tol-pal system-associated acyl-CoA thioesterase [Oxalobacter sp.]|nr:tol-pal system-associated acyl-CoA thioesterase [Oxalobacter sp.]
MDASFVWPVRVYFEDTDSGGVVYYANYLKFYERTRSEWLRTLGISQQSLAQERQVLFVVRNAAVNYHRSAVLDDALSVTLDVARIRGASVEFEQKVIRDADGALCSSCRVTIVCVDGRKMKPMAFPEDILAKFQAASGTKKS